MKNIKFYMQKYVNMKQVKGIKEYTYHDEHGVCTELLNHLIVHGN